MTSVESDVCCSIRSRQYLYDEHSLDSCSPALELHVVTILANRTTACRVSFRSRRITALLVLLFVGGAASRADASCGDWLAGLETTHSQVVELDHRSLPPLACDGPNCRRSRDQLPLRRTHRAVSSTARRDCSPLRVVSFCVSRLSAVHPPNDFFGHPTCRPESSPVVAPISEKRYRSVMTAAEGATAQDVVEGINPSDCNPLKNAASADACGLLKTAEITAQGESRTPTGVTPQRISRKSYVEHRIAEIHVLIDGTTASPS